MGQSAEISLVSRLQNADYEAGWTQTVMTESSSILSSTSPTRLLAVIVIYKRALQESPSFRTLLNAANLISGTSVNLGILIQDNTPGGQYPGDIPEGVLYEAAPNNPGLARAYNRALEIAQEDGYDWLTTLDQDTVLPADFLLRLGELFKKLQPDPAVAAIAPRVVGDGRILSPFIFWRDILPRWFDPAFIGVSEQRTYAVNSASTLRVSALSQIGGYDPMFPLDISDINLFHRLHHHGKRVFVAGDILIHHELALLKKHQRMSIERYQAALLDECAFWDLNMIPLARMERMIRLAGRACKDFLNPEELAFRRATVAELKRRIITPKKRRVEEWISWAKARSASF
jgi:GT2 family glycosyltransferase